jgi:hypothetical protein
MTNFTRTTWRCAAALMIAGWAEPALAQDISEQQAVAPAPFAPPAVDEDALSKIAGREDTAQSSYANQVAGVSNNTVGDNVRTGDATISDNAFQNLSGLSVLNVNTGNNVAINAAMNVNIAISPNP